MPAEADRLPKRADEFFTVRTGAKVFSNFFADRSRKLLVEVSRKAAQHLQALGLGMSVVGEH